MDNRLSIHFGGDRSKPLLFASKRKIKKVPKINIYKSNDIQRSQT